MNNKGSHFLSRLYACGRPLAAEATGLLIDRELF